MAIKTITADVDGVRRTYTLDVPEGASQSDIEDAIANYHAPAPPNLSRPKGQIDPATALGLTPQPSQLKQTVNQMAPPGLMQNTDPNNPGITGTILNQAQSERESGTKQDALTGAGLIGGLLTGGVAGGAAGRAGLYGLLGGGIDALKGGAHPIRSGLEAGLTSLALESPAGAAKVLRPLLPKSAQVAIDLLLSKLGMKAAGAIPEAVAAKTVPGPLPNSTMTPPMGTPPINAPQVPASYIGGGSTLGALTKTKSPQQELTDLLAKIGVR